MGSNSEATQILGYPIVKQPDLQSLRECANLLTTIERGSFDLTYGNLIKLLQLEVQTKAIAALSQFYDSPLRCVTFKIFQLSPTLEEYAQILGFSLHHPGPYQGHYYKEDKLASLLQIKKEDLIMNKKNRNHVYGFPQKYLEQKMQLFARTKNWGPFKEVLALTIFGIVLFPFIEGYVDTKAVCIFLAFRDKENPVSPVPFILAYTYCTFTHYSERNGKRISCCLPVLYVWFVTHAFCLRERATCPIQDAKLWRDQEH